MFGIIPKTEDENIFIFTESGLTTTWQTWIKPSGIKFVQIVAIGAGGGGGRPAISTGFGGGGGGAGGMTTVIYPANFLPAVIYVQVGTKGAGATSSSTSGAAGGITYVGVFAGTGVATRLARGTAGAGGTSTAGGAAGILDNITSVNIASGGQPSFIVGVAGASSGSSSLTAYTTSILTGGAAGGSAFNVAGGSIIGAYNLPTIAGGVGRQSTAGGAGADGIWLWKPMSGTGGAGGGGTESNTGGKGGNGAFGCGGGGGGGAGNTGTTGNGGDGGSGLVIISCW